MKLKTTRLVGKILIFASVLSFMTPTVSFAKEVDDPVPFKTTKIMSDSTNTELDSGYRLLVLSNNIPKSTYAYKVEKGKTNLYVLYYKDKEHMDYSYEVLKQQGYAVEKDVDIVSPETDKKKTEDNITSSNLDDKAVSNEIVDKERTKEEKDEDKDITIAIIDSGLNTKYQNIETKNGITSSKTVDNPLFKDRISENTDESALSDENGHGTIIAKIIAENSNAKILPIKAFKEDGTSNTRNIYYAIMEALEKKADVINLSMEAYGSSEIIKKTIDYAVSLGVPVIVSAGNDNKDTKDYTPANVDSAYTISACDNDGKKEEYSNFGSSVDFAMSGTYKDDNSTNIDEDDKEYTGTSFSAAYFSALIAKIMDKGEYLKDKEDYLSEINSLLISNTNGITDEQIGYGKVDTKNVLSVVEDENKKYLEEKNKQEVSNPTKEEVKDIKETTVEDTSKENTSKVEDKTNKDTKDTKDAKEKDTSSKNNNTKKISEKEAKQRIDNVFSDMTFNLASNEHGNTDDHVWVYYGQWRRYGNTLYLCVHSDADTKCQDHGYGRWRAAPGNPWHFDSIVQNNGKLWATDYYWINGVSNDVQSLLNDDERFTINVHTTRDPTVAGNDPIDHDWFWVHFGQNDRAYEIDSTHIKREVTHTVTYKPNGGGGSDYAESYKHYDGDNFGYNVPNSNTPGFTPPKYKHFTGWSQTAGYHEANSNVDINAQWAWNNYKINYNNTDANTKPNRWTETKTSSVRYTTHTTPSKYNKITYNVDGGSSVPSQTINYLFNGWKVNGKRSVDNVTKSMYAANEAFTWNSTDTNNAYVNLNAVWSDYQLKLPQAPTKDGYYFSGWKSSLDNNVYKAEEVAIIRHNIHKDITFTALWTPVTVNILYSFGSSKNPDKKDGKIIDGNFYQVGSATGNIYLREYKDLTNYTENKTVKDTLNNRDMTYTERYSMQGWSYGADKRYDTKGLYAPRVQKTALNAKNFYKEITSNNPVRVKNVNDTVSNIRNKSHEYENKYQDSNLTALYTDYSKTDYAMSGDGQATQVTVVLHAVWDKYPIIYAKDKFYSIDQLKYALELDQKQGLIGKENSNFAAYVLGINKSSTDMEDTENTTQEIFPSGRIVNPETYYNNKEEFFRQLGEIGVVSVPIEVTDLAGNTSLYPVRINVTNTDTNNNNSKNRAGDKINGSSGLLGESYTWDIRFIDGLDRNNVDEMSDHNNYLKNYTLDGSGIKDGHKNGGLCDSSMWYVDPIWRKEIVATIYSNHNDVPKDSITLSEFNSEKSKLYTKTYTLDRNTIKRIQNIKKHDSSGRLTDWITSVKNQY